MSVTSTTMMDEELGTSVEAKIHHAIEIDEYPGFKVVEPSVTVNTKEDVLQGDDVSMEDDASIASLDGCCTRCVGEYRHSRGWFDIQEASRTLDIPASFGPSSWWARLIKVCLLGLTAGMLIYKWLDDPFDDYPAFFLAYLTHWSLIFATIWFATSCFNSICPPQQPASGSGVPSLWIKFSWLMFEVSALFNMITVILYWSLEYKPGESDINYMNIYVHTGVLLVWVEGLWVNRIPVRMRHLPLNMFLSACYVAWLAIHQLATDIGVPTKHDNDPDTNDDLLYTAVDFREKTVFSTVLVILVIFVAFPLIHWLLWGLSLYSFPCSCRGYNRRYLSATNNKKHHHKSAPDCEATVPGGSSQLQH